MMGVHPCKCKGLAFFAAVVLPLVRVEYAVVRVIALDEDSVLLGFVFE